MIQCQLSVLIDINCKIESIMRCLELSPQTIKTNNKENEILSIIISNLTKALQCLLEKDHCEEMLQGEAETMYQNMQRQLQRQQNLNRSLIKKELEFKEYQKSLFDELTEEKKTVKELKNQLNKLNDKIFAKDLQILQLSNQKRNASKDAARDKKNKEIIMFETLVHDKKLLDPYKNTSKDISIPTHQRRRSDEVSKRPSTANPKKKSSIPKK